MNNSVALSLMEKSSDNSRSLLFGLLVNCIFSGHANGRCPLSHQRDSLTLEEKYNFVMELSPEEVYQVLDRHEKCYENECSPQCRANPRGI